MRRLVLLTLFSDWLPKLASFSILIFVARALGAAEFAVYALALSWIGYAWAVVDLGQGGYSIRTLAGKAPEEETRLGGEIFSLYLALSVVVTTGLVGLLFLTGAAHSPVGRLVAAMTPFLVTYALFPDWWLRATGRLDQLAIANWAYVGGWVLLLALLSRTSLNYALAYAVAPLLGCAVAWTALGGRGIRPRFVPAWSAWVGHLRTSLLFALAGGAGQLAVPLTLAGMTVANPTAAGAYAVGLRISAAAANALWLLLQNTLPRLLRLGQRLSGPRGLAVISLPILGCLVGAGLFWDPILAPILGPSYANSADFVLLGLMTLLIWGPKYLVEIDLLAAFADVPRILVNAVAPTVAALLLVTGLARRSPGIAPTGLLVAEVVGTCLGSLVLSSRQRRASAELAGRVLDDRPETSVDAPRRSEGA